MPCHFLVQIYWSSKYFQDCVWKSNWRCFLDQLSHILSLNHIINLISHVLRTKNIASISVKNNKYQQIVQFRVASNIPKYNHQIKIDPTFSFRTAFFVKNRVEKIYATSWLDLPFCGKIDFPKCWKAKKIGGKNWNSFQKCFVEVNVDWFVSRS